MWNCTPSEGVRLPARTLTEPDQVCLTIREILSRFGALPEVKDVYTGAFDNEDEALAALDVSYLSKEEAFEKAKELADELTMKAEAEAKARPKSEEGPPSSPPQDLEKEEPIPPVGSASSDEAKEA